MYAVIAHSGRQFKVSPGDVIDLQRVRVNVGEPLIFDRVLLVKDRGISIGTPYLADYRVVGTVMEHHRGNKIVVFKYRRRKNYSRKKGFRPSLTKIRIDKIEEVR